MSDEAPVASSGGGGAPAAATDHEYTAHHSEPIAPVPMVSRKSTWNKDMMDVHVSGTQTPMSVNKLSRVEPGLEDYFVSFLTLRMDSMC